MELRHPASAAYLKQNTMEIIKEQINTNTGLTGKTIRRVAHLDEAMFLFFSDETFCIINIREDYDQNQTVNISELNFKANSVDCCADIWNLERLGIIDMAERDELLAIQSPIDAEKFKQKELQYLAVLKEKYEKN